MYRLPFSRRVALFVLVSLLTLPTFTWALPEVDIRSQTNGQVNIVAVPAAPGAFLTTSYTCPALGRIHVLVTGRLQQAVAPHFQQWFTQLSISRNSSVHSSTSRLYDAPGAFNTFDAPDEQDVVLQHLATCDAGQAVTYRLLANKAEAAQPTSVLRDAILSLTFIASSEPNGG